MVNTFNKLIIYSLGLVFIGAIAFVYFDVSSESDLVLQDSEFQTRLSLSDGNESIEPVSVKVKAGKIKNIQGKVFVRPQEGAQKKLISGDDLRVGDIVQTGKNAKTQIEFSDKSKVTLYANTQLKIVEYSYDKDKAGINIARLLKGQLKVVSGLIGKRKGDKYQMRTRVSTIGIRGTEYVLRDCYKLDCYIDGKAIKAGLYMGVIDGEIISQSEAGDTIIQKGELFFQVNKNETANKIDIVEGLLVDGNKIASASQNNDSRQWILEKVN